MKPVNVLPDILAEEILVALMLVVVVDEILNVHVIGKVVPLYAPYVGEFADIVGVPEKGMSGALAEPVKGMIVSESVYPEIELTKIIELVGVVKGPINPDNVYPDTINEETLVDETPIRTAFVALNVHETDQAEPLYVPKVGALADALGVGAIKAGAAGEAVDAVNGRETLDPAEFVRCKVTEHWELTGTRPVTVNVEPESEPEGVFRYTKPEKD
jgi:hypothetical protein